MFNLSPPTNVRCNGVVSNAARHLGRSQRSSISSSNPSDGKVRVKVEFSAQDRNALANHVKTEPCEDPYTFSDSETHLNNIKVNTLNFSSRKPVVCKINNLLQSTTKLVDNTVVNKISACENTDVKQNETWKAMNRLQSQVAKSKVIVKHKKESPDTKDRIKGGFLEVFVKEESDTKPSIIGLSDDFKRSVPALRKISTGKPLPSHLKARRANLKTTHHEALQRIRKRRTWHAPTHQGSLVESLSMSDTDSDDDQIISVFRQQEWSGEMAEELELDRESRIEKTRSRLQRILAQQQDGNTTTSPCQTSSLISSLLQTRCSQASIDTILAQHSYTRNRVHVRLNNSTGLLAPRLCCSEVDDCKQYALPCTRYCARHIMQNSDQCLYDYCTAKFADNTQCCIPVVDLNHELPLCTEHARKRDNYNRMCQVIKPKKPRKKVKPSAMIRPQKRNKKRKRPPPKSTEKLSKHDSSMKVIGREPQDLTIAETSSPCESSDELGLNSLGDNSELVTQTQFGGEDADDDMVAQVLGVGEELPLELAGPAEALVTQASRLLEETDLTNVFNQIPPDAFNDLFAIDRNGAYEPTREETEELERALEAVNQDVKSLEKMSQTQGILDTLLDEHALVESLAQMPDVFPSLNGFSVNSGGTQPSVSTTLPPRPIHGLDNIISVQPPAHMSS